MKRRIIILASAICALGLVGAFALRDPASGAKVTISFVGYTNASSGLFRLDNESRSTICYWVGVPQMRTDGVWPSPHFGTNDGIWTLPAEVAGGMASTFAVEVLAGKKDWRVPVVWYVKGKETTVLGMLKFNYRVFRWWWPQRRQTPYPGFRRQGDQNSRLTYSATVTE